MELFEPLKIALEHHANNLQESLERIEARLAALSGDIEAEIEEDQFVAKGESATTGAKKEVDISFRASGGFAWRVRTVGVTGGPTGNCAVYLNAVTPTSLLGVLSPTLLKTENIRWYVPRGGTLIFHFYEQPENQVCTVSFQAEEFATVPDRQARTGVSNEGIESPQRVPVVPSGHPLEGGPPEIPSNGQPVE
jgi:hypothetical protein